MLPGPIERAAAESANSLVGDHSTQDNVFASRAEQ